MIALQNCVGFYQTSTWIGRYTYVLSLLNLPSTSHPRPPLYTFTEPQFEFPESYSKFPLAIHFTYGNVCFQVTLSIHPTLSLMSLALADWPTGVHGEMSTCAVCCVFLQWNRWASLKMIVSAHPQWDPPPCQGSTPDLLWQDWQLLMMTFWVWYWL